MCRYSRDGRYRRDPGPKPIHVPRRVTEAVASTPGVAVDLTQDIGRLPRELRLAHMYALRKTAINA